MRRWIILIGLLLLIPLAAAQKDVKILAVEETDEGSRGGIASLSLRTVLGNGDIYVATYPFTKVDTQVSARFAKQIACDFADVDCSNFDFLYTIKAHSAIVSGPSAGAALSAITVAELMNLNLNEKVVITGTVNSGGFVGPVGGLKKKIEAAALDGIEVVMISKGSRFIEINDTKLDAVEYGKELGITVVEVSQLSEVMEIYTGKNFSDNRKEIDIDPAYLATMEEIALSLCNRSENLRKAAYAKYKRSWNDSITKALNLSRRASEAFEENNFYSAASFCFGSNIEYRNLLYAGMTKQEFIEELQKLSKLTIEEQPLHSVNNLQTAMIVHDRLNERTEILERAVELLNRTIVLNKTAFKDAIFQLAFARERLFSALAWSSFYSDVDTGLKLDPDVLRLSCTLKLQEAQERIDYAEVYFPSLLDPAKKQLERAIIDRHRGKYIDCLHKSSKVKAHANVMLSALGVREENVDTILHEKFNVAKSSIAKQTDFPIIAYSYYRYGQSLIESDKNAAFLYAEYAIELANLDMYFKTNFNASATLAKKIWLRSDLVFLIGIFVGLIIQIAFNTHLGRRKSKNWYLRKYL